jgi:hypothetical protein
MFEGLMINGRIEGNVSPQTASLSDWRMPIGIGIRHNRLSVSGKEFLGGGGGLL